ncbi:MATE family multidrug resistance protein [Balneicella halophila]|uniref:Multidrug-efflux transporter n=1 Tax=Balneicella halophila TaxID=1537566 RepID=A0A7L4UPQ8_BALHA|nr:MATE family efflux transporter [Balneicella halophila]PVX51758.1 MATE family multidrug resistance protein [Balneicella halophila]
MTKYLGYYKRNLRLAFPIVLSQLGQIVVQQADIMMVGRLGPTELAAIAFANSIFIFGMVFAMGFSLGLTPAVGHVEDKTQYKLLAKILSNAYIINIVIAVCLMILMYVISFFFSNMGQDPAVVSLAKPYYVTILLSLLPLSLFFTNKQFAEGLGDTKNAMYVTLFANFLNIFLNYVLIFGKWGFPELGMLGAGLATLTSRIFMALGFYAIFLRRNLFNRITKYIDLRDYSRLHIRKLFKLGLPISMQMFLEVAAFALSGIMAGWLGVISLASHQIAMGISSMTFMLAIGVGAATTIRVSHYYGEQNFKRLMLAATASTHIVLAFMGLSGLLIFLFRHDFPYFYNTDENVVALTAILLVATAIFQVFDGLQVVMLSILRGLGDVTYAMIYSFVAYILVNLPTSYFLAFTLDLGTVGLWYGFIFGLAVAGLLFYSRIRTIYKSFNS